MAITLKPNQRLMFDDYTRIRAPDGTLLPQVPQYVIVDVSEADPDRVEVLKKGEILEHIGGKAGRSPDGKFLPSTPLYKKVKASEVNPQSGSSKGEETLVADMAKVFAWRFKQYVDGVKAEEQRARKASEVLHD